MKKVLVSHMFPHTIVDIVYLVSKNVSVQGCNIQLLLANRIT